MNVAEHKLNLFRQIDNLPEELLIKLESIVSQWCINDKIESEKNNEIDKFRGLWQEGITSGDSKLLNMQLIKDEALRRYNKNSR